MLAAPANRVRRGSRRPGPALYNREAPPPATRRHCPPWSARFAVRDRRVRPRARPAWCCRPCSSRCPSQSAPATPRGDHGGDRCRRLLRPSTSSPRARGEPAPPGRPAGGGERRSPPTLARPRGCFATWAIANRDDRRPAGGGISRRRCSRDPPPRLAELPTAPYAPADRADSPRRVAPVTRAIHRAAGPPLAPLVAVSPLADESRARAPQPRRPASRRNPARAVGPARDPAHDDRHDRKSRWRSSAPRLGSYRGGRADRIRRDQACRSSWSAPPRLSATRACGRPAPRSAGRVAAHRRFLALVTTALAFRRRPVARRVHAADPARPRAVSRCRTTT